MIDENRYYTIKEVCEILKIHRSTFYRLAKKNGLSVRRVGRKVLVEGREIRKLLK